MKQTGDQEGSDSAEEVVDPNITEAPEASPTGLADISDQDDFTWDNVPF